MEIAGYYIEGLVHLTWPTLVHRPATNQEVLPFLPEENLMGNKDKNTLITVIMVLPKEPGAHTLTNTLLHCSP
jgi:hypothetical protein